MAANEVVNGTLTVGDFILLQAYFMQLSGPLFNMGMFFREVAQSSVDVEDLYYILQQKSAVEEAPDAKEFRFEQGLIEFRNVSFGHRRTAKGLGGGADSLKAPIDAETGEEVADTNDSEIKHLFENFNLKIEAGTTNAIVGPSGFGKTSMLHLLFRIYDPTQGQVLIDGQDVKDLKFESFRKHIVVVPQNGILFNDTIERNILYGNPQATQEDVIRVAQQCSLHESIMNMPDQYQTQVGDLGSKLSGGERQRVLIARGLLKPHAEIFLFDEATSNLDANTEHEIMSELESIMKGKTVIYCAHRLSSIVNVDKIHVVMNGRLAEQGTHKKLLSDPGSAYSHMWSNIDNSKRDENA